MFDDPKHLPSGTVTAKAARTPLAGAAVEIDFTYDSLPQKGLRVRPYDLADKLVAGNSGKPVITPLKLEVGVADAPSDQADEGKAREPSGSGDAANFDAPIFEKD